MRHFIDIIRESVDDDFFLYHGTSEPSEKIRAHGLKPGRHGCIFLTDNPELALDYAQTDQERTGFDTTTIVSVRVSDLDVTKLLGDLDHTTTDDWRESLRETDQCMYAGPIPSNVLTIEEY